MQYVGGKFRQARYIETEVLKARGKRETYVEPFLGGGATFARNARHFETARGSDIVPDLMLMWQALQQGWTPPEHVSEKEWLALKDAEPSALRGFVGFGCSFGGIWFSGYAKSNKTGDGQNYAGISARSVLRQIEQMWHAEFSLLDYREVEVDENTVVYADPPYMNTVSCTANARLFNTIEFWRVAEKWAGTGAAVLVSEYQAPPEWVPVWSRDRGGYLGAAGVETLYAPPA